MERLQLRDLEKKNILGGNALRVLDKKFFQIRKETSWLTNEKFLVTAGTTRVPIDKVRGSTTSSRDGPAPASPSTS